MKRPALILLMFVALLDGRHPDIMTRGRPGWRTGVVHAERLPLDENAPDRAALGELRYLGGWSLTSPSPAFGGVSSLSVDDGGRVTALSDSGVAMMFMAGRERTPLLYRQLPIADSDVGAQRWRWDTESMASDPVSGQVWVGYEVDGHICRYSAGLSRLDGCVYPPASARWPAKTSMETLVRLNDGRFLAIAEDSPGPGGNGHDVLLFAGDPVDPATPPPARFSYAAPTGYLPTDAVAIGPDKLLVLNRRFTLMNLFTAVLTLVDLSDLNSGAILRGREVARLTSPVQHDNFEGLAISREDDQTMLWIASDDNHLFLQRSLLLKFALPRAWMIQNGTQITQSPHSAATVP